MNTVISKTIKLSAMAATLLLGATAAQASVYSGDTGHYLQVPQGYSSTTTTTTANRTFNGQGMGTGQLQSTTTASNTQSNTVIAPAAASSRMLPQGYSAPVAMPMQQQAMPTASTAPVAMPARIQAASAPASQPSAQSLAAMEPAAGSAFDSNTNVKVAPSCGTPSNHRQHKGINTSTTVGNDCFN